MCVALGFAIDNLDSQSVPKTAGHLAGDSMATPCVVQVTASADRQNVHECGI